MDLAPTKESALRWALAVGAFALLLFFFSPAWSSFVAWARLPEMQNLIEVRRGASVLQQVETPGAALQDPLHAAIQWRLLFPLLGNLLSLPVWLLFLLSPLGCVAVLGYVCGFLRDRGQTWLECFCSLLLLGSVSWFFASTGWLGYYDSWLVLALLVVAFSPRAWALWSACLLGPWIDERFVLGAALALLLRFVLLRHEQERPTPRESWIVDYGIPAALLALFAFVRLALLSSHSASGATVGGYLATQHNLQAPLGRLLLGVWDGLRLAWLPLLAFFFFSKRPKLWLSILGGASLLVLLVGLVTAQDFSRSMCLLYPLALAGVPALASLAKAVCLEPKARLLAFAAGAAVLLPAHHVMNDRVQPIFYLYHELAALETPPPILTPEFYELDGIAAMEQGDFARAENRLTMALRLSDKSVSAAKHRGLLYASAGRWAEARADFSLMTERDASNPEGWFLRAQASFATGESTAAGNDFRQALRVAPPEWSRRPDVSRFAARLAQGSGN